MKDFPLTCEAPGYENYLRIFRIHTQILPIRFLSRSGCTLERKFWIKWTTH